jgi:hypothetical protein
VVVVVDDPWLQGSVVVCPALCATWCFDPLTGVP